MVAARRFQHAFGRSAQTKILDAVWNHRKNGVNIKQISKIIRQSYFFTIVALKPLLRRALVLKQRRGVESIIRPNLSHPVTRSVGKMPK